MVGTNRCEDAGELADRLPQGSGRQNYVGYWAPPAPPEEVVRYVGISRSLESRCRSHSEPYRSGNLATMQLPPLELNEARSVEEALIAHFGIVNELATFEPRVGQLMNLRHVRHARSGLLLAAGARQVDPAKQRLRGVRDRTVHQGDPLSPVMWPGPPGELPRAAAARRRASARTAPR